MNLQLPMASLIQSFMNGIPFSVLMGRTAVLRCWLVTGTVLEFLLNSMVHAIASIQAIIRIKMWTRLSGVISSYHLDLLHRYYHASALLASLSLQG